MSGRSSRRHLGWAAAGLGRQIGDMLAQYQRTAKSADLRKLLGTIYEETDERAEIKRMDDGELGLLAAQLSHGVPMASPVFDGAREEDIVGMLTKAGLDSSGQVTLSTAGRAKPSTAR